MIQPKFLLQLALVTAGTAVLLWLLLQKPDYGAFAAFSWITLLFFAVFTLIASFQVQLAAKSTNKNQFTNAFLGVTMVKLFFSAILIVGYQMLFKPDSKMFVLPFFAIYLIFTIFETTHFMKLGRTA